MDLPQLTISQHAEIERVVFFCFTDKPALRNSTDKERSGISVIQLIDKIAL
jgi:hypothetical protein